MNLAYGCPDLRAIDLCGCVLITGILFKLVLFPTEFSIWGAFCRISTLGLSWDKPSVDFICTKCRYSWLNVCWFDDISDDSVVALANSCRHLRSLGLYYCQNITDRAMYSLAQSRMKGKHEVSWASVKNRYEEEEEGLTNLNISQCTALTPPAVQALCDSFPALHTCSGRHSLIISGCLNLTSVHCACAVQAHRGSTALPRLAHWIHGCVYRILFVW